MVNLALKSVLHDWRRYLPVVIAVGVSGLLMVVQLALATGAFRLAAAPVRQSSAALWVGPESARGVDQSRGLSPFAAGPLWLDPDIVRVEPWRDGQQAIIGESAPGADDAEIGTPVSVVGIPVDRAGLAFARIIPLGVRSALAEPGTAVIGPADARKLGLGVGDSLRVGGQNLRILAIVPGLRGMFGVLMVASEATARGMASGAGTDPAFYQVALRPGADPAAVAERLSARSREMKVWRSEALARATIRIWALESGAGEVMMASSGMALAITLLIVNQSLGAAVAGSLREYAALRAYGVAFRSVQGIVLRQGFYVLLGALAITGLAAATALAVMSALHVPVGMPLPMALGVAGVLAAVVMISNLLALRRLRAADPASLLR